jgi:hypothetical protein
MDLFRVALHRRQSICFLFALIYPTYLTLLMRDLTSSQGWDFFALPHLNTIRHFLG